MTARTRQRPFEADNYNALLRAIIEDTPHPIFAHGVDQPELWDILAKGAGAATTELISFSHARRSDVPTASSLMPRATSQPASASPRSRMVA